MIEGFQDRPDGVTVGDVAARTGLSRASVRRLLITLERLGYASHNGPVYRLTSRALRLGFSFLSSNSLATLALPVLQEISAVIHESSSLSMLEGDEIVYLARSATQRVMSVGLSVGSRLPAYCTSMGRVMLANLTKPESRRLFGTGGTPGPHAQVDREEGGVRRGVGPRPATGLRAGGRRTRTRAALVSGAGAVEIGQVVAAINTGVQAARSTANEMVKRFLPVLREGAERLSIALP